MSKHIKETQITILRSRILNYSVCRTPPVATDKFYNTRHPSAHVQPYTKVTSCYQALQESKPRALSIQRYNDLHHAFLLDVNCNSNTRIRYRLASGFGDTRLTGEQPQQRTACYLGLGSNAAQKESKHLHSGYSSFLSLVKRGPRGWDALRIQTSSLQRSAPDEGANVI